MPERGIILKPWEVRGLLDGRKTMLLRVVNPQPLGTLSSIKLCGTQEKWRAQYGWQTADGKRYEWRCPFGSPGDVLWCKESYKPQCGQTGDGRPAGRYILDGEWLYGKPLDRHPGHYLVRGHTVPSTHCPRWACRLFRTTQAVRVLRVQELSDEDAIALGITGDGGQWATGCKGDAAYKSTPRLAFMYRFNEDNPKYPSDTNSWCWLGTTEAKNDG